MTPNGIYDLILKHWDEIAAVGASRSGPRMFSLTTRGLRELPFDAPRRQAGGTALTRRELGEMDATAADLARTAGR